MNESVRLGSARFGSTSLRRELPSPQHLQQQQSPPPSRPPRPVAQPVRRRDAAGWTVSPLLLLLLQPREPRAPRPPCAVASLSRPKSRRTGWRRRSAEIPPEPSFGCRPRIEERRRWRRRRRSIISSPAFKSTAFGSNCLRIDSLRVATHPRHHQPWSRSPTSDAASRNAEGVALLPRFLALTL